MLHDGAAAVLLLRLSIEHLALRAQAVGFGDEGVDFLASLQDGFNGFVEDDLRFVEFFLDLGGALISSDPFLHLTRWTWCVCASPS